METDSVLKEKLLGKIIKFLTKNKITHELLKLQYSAIYSAFQKFYMQGSKK